MIHPINIARVAAGEPELKIDFPPAGWMLRDRWGDGYCFVRREPRLMVLVDCEKKNDGRYWVHVSVSKLGWCPTHEEMCLVKRDFLGDRYAYAVYPPKDKYVNIHARCLHLWSLAEGLDGRILPEFSAELEGVGLSI